MDTIELFKERDLLRVKGVDIIVKPIMCGHHGFKRKYTYEIFYRTQDASHDDDAPARPLGIWEDYYEALEGAINTAKDVLEKAKNFGLKF